MTRIVNQDGKLLAVSERRWNLRVFLAYDRDAE